MISPQPQRLCFANGRTVSRSRSVTLVHLTQPAPLRKRCQFHLTRNAIHHAPNVTIRKRIGAELREVWTAGSLAKAETALAELVADYRDTAPKLAAWLEENAPEGLAVFSLPKHHRRRMRTSNPMERGVQQELKRRTVKVRVFPNEASLERLVSAVLIEIDDKWAADSKAYIKWECQDE